MYRGTQKTMSLSLMAEEVLQVRGALTLVYKDLVGQLMRATKLVHAMLRRRTRRRRSGSERLRRGRPKKYADERREPRDAERVYLATHSHRVYDVGVILGVPLGVMFMPRTVLADAYTQTFNDLLVTKQNGTILIFSPFPPIPSITGTIQNLTKRASTTRPLVCP
jgi:hypothetical protein